VERGGLEITGDGSSRERKKFGHVSGRECEEVFCCLIFGTERKEFRQSFGWEKGVCNTHDSLKLQKTRERG
jgi:hypothetical protein